MPLVPERLALLGDISLKHGSHPALEDGLCIMEAVAWVAGEPHSDHPACACPVISAFLRTWNDSLPDDATRTRLLAPLAPSLVGSRSTAEVEMRRSVLAMDWMVRVYTPAWLELLPDLPADAVALRALKPIETVGDLQAALEPLVAAKKNAAAAWAAAWAAAGDAAWAAAWAAARDAAWDAAGAAAWTAAWAAAWAAARAAARDAAGAAAWAAARDAAGDAAGAAARAAARAAAWAAAGDAAWDAAWDAAKERLRPLVEQLQGEAVRLIERMLAVTPAEAPAP